MNIKKAEELSGVSRQNIRFYEREGLLAPDRNPENDYREYHEEHIHILKQIRAMRLMDMPLDQIRLVLEGKQSPAAAAALQQQKLKQQQAQLAAAIRFCEEWSAIDTLEMMNVDEMLERMDQPENAQGLFQKWKEDYRRVVLSEREKVFTFVPEEAVTNPQEFTLALFAYANANGLDLVVTKEGMYPEFTINGIEYTAERFYTVVARVPVATIRCSVKYPEDFAPEVPEKRKKIMKLLHLSWLPAVFILANLGVILVMRGQGLLRSWEGWLIALSLLALSAVSLYRTWLFYYNNKH